MTPDTEPSAATAFAAATIERARAALGRVEPATRAFWLYDLDGVAARAARFAAAFRPLAAATAYALKANPLPAILTVVREAGFAAEAGSLGELEIASAAGFASASRILNGNGRTPEEAAWIATHGVHSVNADHVGELDLLEREAARAGARVRVALRVNPGIPTPGHRYVATGDDDAKFGIAPAEALEAWRARDRWPHLQVDGVHLHVGSQLLEPGPLERALDVALELAAASARAGAPLGLVNLGGGLGVDHEGGVREFPLEAWAARVRERARSVRCEWAFEPGRWMVASAGALVSEVLWVKERRDASGATRRFVVLAAGMNDLLRPALYGAHHRIEPVRPRAGALAPATVVGPVCESADVFARDVALPPLEPGDLVRVHDAGAYGAAMASNYNGRGRLAEVVWRAGRLRRARAAETPADLVARRRDDPLDSL